MTILHISDPHAQLEAMCRLDDLGTRRKCDVVALTGDCTSSFETRIPSAWNEWPQQYKFAVPGNHDHEDTFADLTEWTYEKDGWAKNVGPLGFVGVDTSENWGVAVKQLQRFGSDAFRSISAFVVLSHRWPNDNEVDRAGEALHSLAHDKPLVVLHGHDHPREFDGSLWEPEARLGRFPCCRSKVCSSATERGLAHYITWVNGQFSYERVRGVNRRNNQ